MTITLPQILIPPIPTSGQIDSWLTDNTLYAQRPLTNVRCELQPVNPHASIPEQETAMNDFIACLMKVWSVPVTDAGYTLPRPAVTVYDQPIQTPCGKEETHNAFYCMTNQQFYYATDLADALPNSISTKSWIVEVILAHEFGHAVQGRSGILSARNRILKQTTNEDDAMLLSRRSEAQADCFSGAFLQAIATSQGFDEATIASFKEAYYSFGDDVLSGKAGFVADHGSGASRQNWGTKGLDIGGNGSTLGACNSWNVASSEVN